MSEDNEDLLASNLMISSVDAESYVLSPFELTAELRGRTITLDRIRYYDGMLWLTADIGDYGIHDMGTMTFRLQLPTVFGDNRKTIIVAKWNGWTKTASGNSSPIIREMSVNGVKTDSPIATLIVE